MIPDELGGKTVTPIGHSVFFKNDLTSVTLPSGLTSIGDGAFWNNRLTSVALPFGVRNGQCDLNAS
ncbi:leucine-rich repeat protein [Sporosarcina sp. FSL W7-1349]|uniref:leucine-rich repeat protein n=1 Tax=Sporosarcina sp. FSL W7-1349 TaxID=2921561 RepID=UPI004046913D